MRDFRSQGNWLAKKGGEVVRSCLSESLMSGVGREELTSFKGGEKMYHREGVQKRPGPFHWKIVQIGKK